MIGYAEAVHEGTLEKAWATGDRSSISVYYSGELDQQVFGDLDSDNMIAEARDGLEQHPLLVGALDGFLPSSKRLDAWIEEHVDTETWGRGELIPTGVGSIFRSSEWSNIQTRAATLLSAAQEAGYSSKDFDPTP